ncbi:MAG: autotransporter assembly complex family protein [Pseudomonadota bacterium]
MFSIFSKRISLVLLLLLCHNLYASDYTVDVQIDGVKGELLDNVRAVLSIEQKKNDPRLSHSRIKRLHKQAPDEIKRALQPFGYYDVNVTSELTPKQKVWKAHYKIELGEPLKIKAEINLSGDAKQDKVFEKQLDDFPVKTGDQLNHPKYETAKRILRNLAEERGYFDAEFTKNEIRIDEQAYTANVLLSFDSKRRYRFGDIIFKQDKDKFDKSFLQRFSSFEPGDYYTTSALLTFKKALINSQYFERADIDMARTSFTKDLRMPVEVSLVPRKRNKYSASIGYGTDTGVRGSLGWERRYINRRGHRLSAKAEWAERRKSATARYYIPTGKQFDDFLAITTGYKDETTDTSESETLLLGISKNHKATRFGTKLSEIIGIEYYIYEKYKIGNDTGHSKLLMPYISWSYLKRDNPIYTRRGHKIQLDIRGALSDVGSNTSFWQAHLNTIFIRSVLEDGRVIARGEVGYSDISLLNGDFHDLPPSIRFFAGGDRSVRGYDYEALGPINEEGEVIGGKHLLVASLEYEHKILEKWSLAAFFDVGNAFNGFSESLKQGAGVGVRWHSVVGLIRVDVATALSEASYPVRLHIRVGPDL